MYKELVRGSDLRVVILMLLFDVRSGYHIWDFTQECTPMIISVSKLYILNITGITELLEYFRGILVFIPLRITAQNIYFLNQLECVLILDILDFT